MEQSDRRTYRNLGGDLPVRDFAVGPSFIRVWFKDGAGYEYDDSSPGREHVDAMKHLAEAGRGLATYISQYVQKNYARKL